MFLSALGTVSGQDFCILFRIQNDRFVVYITINHQPSTNNSNYFSVYGVAFTQISKPIKSELERLTES